MKHVWACRAARAPPGSSCTATGEGHIGTQNQTSLHLCCTSVCNMCWRVGSSVHCCGMVRIHPAAMRQMWCACMVLLAQIYGFYYELYTKLGAEDALDLFYAINDSFDWLPLAAIISDSAGNPQHCHTAWGPPARRRTTTAPGSEHASAPCGFVPDRTLHADAGRCVQAAHPPERLAWR